MRIKALGACASAIALFAGAAQAEITGNVVKIGVLNDQSGLYADLAGQGSVEAARMAVEDFGGIDGVRSRCSRPTTRTSPTSARTWCASGSTSTRST